MSSTDSISGATPRGKLIALGSIAAALVLGTLVVFAIDRRPRTHDARLFAFSAAMASEINGRIVRVCVSNDQHVAKGSPLIVIDPAPYEMQLRQARAQVAALKAQIGLTGRQVESQGSGARAAESQVQKAREQLKLAEDTRERLEPLVAPGYVTQQQLDEARTNESSALAALSALTKSATQAHQAVGDTLSLEAQLEGAKAAEALAARNLELTIHALPLRNLSSNFRGEPAVLEREARLRGDRIEQLYIGSRKWLFRLLRSEAHDADELAMFNAVKRSDIYRDDDAAALRDLLFSWWEERFLQAHAGAPAIESK